MDNGQPFTDEFTQDGEPMPHLAVVGPRGSGKTALLNSLTRQIGANNSAGAVNFQMVLGGGNLSVGARPASPNVARAGVHSRRCCSGRRATN